MILPRLFALTVGLWLMMAYPLQAGVTLLRDADIEYSLRQLADPVLRAAGLSPNQVQILVIDDNTLNAFVVDTQRIFLHSGLILKLKTAAELQAVIAHEAAHITNGHITRRLGNMRAARNAAGLGLILAAAAGAAAGGEAGGEVAAGIAIGSQSSALRLFLSHTRAEEASADIASVRYLLRAGVDPAGAVAVQELFRGQEALSVSRQDPYMRTHPLTSDRLRALKGLVAGHTGQAVQDGAANYWFARIQGKLSAFSRAPNWTLRRAKDSASRDIALMREAVAHHRQSNLSKALPAIDAALALRTKDPYLLELKGQILLESRQFEASAQVYRAAAAMAPREALILGGYGRALLAVGRYSDALNVLEQARNRDFGDARILRDLAVAYARSGQNAMASVVTAERYALQGRLDDAEIHAKRAEGALPQGSGPWQRAQDVLDAARRAKRR
ncbi:M48 family metalloprotease [Thalassococcus sp. CAU 1522]|uniref:M48 family metalloprotease n=1 Tax=Thalassococcus arenae TaxID=2851652 RepID=A0ABS6NAI0_9RHOB|nr:M48 family metalloprotease [Thalassococcus arenae]MBV2361009.1 M48 family metalloprotease [Thalassococcus arenae]